jgi:hypothetical protein
VRLAVRAHKQIALRVPAALAIGLLAFSPAVINLLDSVPSVVIGCVLLYIATTQVASGLVLPRGC